MFKLIQFTPFSDINYISEALELLSENGSFIYFNEFENIENVFFNDLYASDSIIIAAIENNSVFGILVLKKFEKLSVDKFVCYMFGAAKRGFAKEIEQALTYIFSDLKNKGCAAVRIETLCSNRAMRNLANRMNFRKAGKFEASGMRKNKLLSCFLYEKVL